MARRLKVLWRRWRLFTRGECIEDGCEELRALYFDRCSQHAAEDFERHCAARRRAKFNRDAEVVAEGIRRAASNEPSTSGGGSDAQ